MASCAQKSVWVRIVAEVGIGFQAGDEGVFISDLLTTIKAFYGSTNT